MNQVAEAVGKEFPHVWIETLAYQYTRTPPKTLRPRPNVVPRLCSIECDFSLPLDVSPYPQNVKFVDDIKGWSAITDKLYVWDYTTNFGHYIGPHPNFGCLQGNVKFFRDNSVVGLFEQGAYQSPHAEFAELRAWVLAKLLWNPEQDVKALYDDFFAGYYGPAAEPVRAYFDELQSLAASPDHVLRLWSPMTSPWYTDEFFARAATLWADAESRVAADPDRLYNVRMGAIPVMYARLQRWPRMETGHEWRDGTLRPTGVDPGYAEIARELLARIEEGKITHVSESHDRHKAFVSMLRARTEGFTPVMIRSGDTVAGVIPDLGGRTCILSQAGGPNVLHPTDGGVGFSDGPGAFTGAETTPYGVATTEASAVVLRRAVRNRYEVERVAAVSSEGLTVTNRLTSSRTEEQTIRPAVRVALDLGDAASICARAEGGSWLTLPVPAEQAFAMATIPVPASASRTLLIASAKTGRGARMQLPDGPIERVLLHCDALTGAVRVVVAMAPMVLPGKGTLEAAVRVVPVAQATGLPSMPPPPAGTHGRGKVVVEECLISLGRPGS